MTSGNTTVSAELVSQSSPHAWAKAGVMIRMSDAAGAAYVAVTQTVGNGLSFEYRTATGATGQYTLNAAVTSGPVYLKLVRVGNTFTGYYSSDGVNYTQLGSITVTMAANTFTGLAVTSHTATDSNVAVFKNVSITSP